MIAIPLFAASLILAVTGDFTTAWVLLLIGFCDATFGGYAKPTRKPAAETAERINEYVPFDGSRWLP